VGRRGARLTSAPAHTLFGPVLSIDNVVGSYQSLLQVVVAETDDAPSSPTAGAVAPNEMQQSYTHVMANCRATRAYVLLLSPISIAAHLIRWTLCLA